MNATSTRIRAVVAARYTDSPIFNAERLAGAECFVVDSSAFATLVGFLKHDPDVKMDMLLDVYALEHADDADKLLVRAELLSTHFGHRCTVEIHVAAIDPAIESLASHFPAAHFLERECFEMHGVHFEGHIRMTPIYLYDGFVGHPLRRSYRHNKTQPLVVQREAPSLGVQIVESGTEEA